MAFSSIASLLGSGGQSNYSASNGALERWSDDRGREGSSAAIVQWGAWESVGMAVRGDAGTADRMRRLGFGMLTVDDGIGVLESVVVHITRRRDLRGALCASPFDW